MVKKISYLLLSLFLISCSSKSGDSKVENTIVSESPFLTYTADLKKDSLQLFWKDYEGNILKTFENLKRLVESENRTLLFAMNGGMFKKDYSPQGLLIQGGRGFNAIDSSSGDGNFYLKPNGVFYITSENTAGVCKTQDIFYQNSIEYATQSGPMLVIDSLIHPAFKQESNNLNIRNGVGILPDGKPIFVMSKQEINFYDFASYFLCLGCKNALYLDGFVSRAYLPAKNWVQNDGKFGVMIGVTSKNK